MFWGVKGYSHAFRPQVRAVLTVGKAGLCSFSMGLLGFWSPACLHFPSWPFNLSVACPAQGLHVSHSPQFMVCVPHSEIPGAFATLHRATFLTPPPGYSHSPLLQTGWGLKFAPGGGRTGCVVSCWWLSKQSGFSLCPSSNV